MDTLVTPQHFQLIDKDEAKFILEHAEKHLRDTLDVNNIILSRVSTLIAITSTVTVAVFGFGVNRLDGHGWDKLVTASALALIYMLFVMKYLIKNIQPNDYATLGAHPKDLFTDKAFNERNKDYRLTAIYVNEIIECQKRIELNKFVNHGRWGFFNTSLKLVSAIPFVFAGIYLVIVLAMKAFSS